jgi:hypothetical protein
MPSREGRPPPEKEEARRSLSDEARPEGRESTSTHTRSPARSQARRPSTAANSLDGLPENFQQSERGEKLQEYIDVDLSGLDVEAS